VQDDNLDKGTEIAAIHQIFQRVYLTISASSTKSSADGLLKTTEEAQEIIARPWVHLPYLSPNIAGGMVTLKLSED
jgi:hypothetical protein